jgi:hypothetical protein
MPVPLFRRVETFRNPKTRQEETRVVLMVRNNAGRHLAIWVGSDESKFHASEAGKAWAAGERLPLPSVGSPRGAGHRKAHCVDS